MIGQTRKALVLAPHTDDGELGCGATISKMLRNSVEVYYAAFSSCSDSLPPSMPKDTLVKELYSAMDVLGIPERNVHVFPFRVRHFAESRQEILDRMIQLSRQINPDTIFLPSIHDTHQDHAVIVSEGLRAFKKMSILAYELPWNNFTFDYQLFSCVEACDVAKKVEAIKCYMSQTFRDYTNEDYVHALLRSNGARIGVPYAEAFETPRIVMR